MGTAKDIVEILSKEKWIVYFMLFGAGSLFFYAASGFAEGYDLGRTTEVLAMLGNLMGLLAGVMLGLLALKFLLKGDFIGALSKERLLVIFMLFWAGYFFFWGLYGIFSYGPWALESAEEALALVAGLSESAAGAVLALFGWKLFQSKEPA